MQKITLRARAKINLTLDILGVLENGYHSMNMVMQSIDLYDDITLEKRGKTELVCDLSIRNEQNLALRAQKMLEEETGKPLPVRVTLEKNIPMAAGLAGGSADAAAVFRGLNLLYDLNLSKDRLCCLAGGLGKDIPYCLTGGTCLAQGDGTVLTPIDSALFGYGVLVMPCEGLSTKEIFRKYDTLTRVSHPDIQSVRRSIADGDWMNLKKAGGNVLFQAADAENGKIRESIDRLYALGAAYASMSGSGPSVFGWFTEQSARDCAVKALTGVYPLTVPCGFAENGTEILTIQE